MTAEVHRFPTARKAAYRQPADWWKSPTPENVRLLRPKREPRPAPPPPQKLPSGDPALPSQSIEMALLFGIISALSVGNDRDRARFNLIRYEIGRFSADRPDDESLRGALRLLDLIAEANHGL